MACLKHKTMRLYSVAIGIISIHLLGKILIVLYIRTQLRIVDRLDHPGDGD